jgi:hypothetical protein
MECIMSKQDKIEAARKQKAVLVTKPKSTLEQIGKAIFEVATAKIGERFYKIAGTQVYGRKKEELKDIRRSMNLEAGTPEFTYTGEDESKTRIATDSNTWRFRVTKGPDHPAA